MRLPKLTQEFVKENPIYAWEILRLRRLNNCLVNYDFTPYIKDDIILNVKNLQTTLLNHINSLESKEFANLSEFYNLLSVGKSFFVLTPEQVAKHFKKIKTIFLDGLILSCEDEGEKRQLYQCLTDLKSLEVEYKLEKNQTKNC